MGPIQRRRNRRRDQAAKNEALVRLEYERAMENEDLPASEREQLQAAYAAFEAASSDTRSEGTIAARNRSNAALSTLRDVIEMLDVETESSADALSGDSSDSNQLLDLIENPADLADLFERDPAEFMESWRDLTAEERSIVMQRLQTQMQMENQITQMITNLMKALHDTSMAVARNLKV